MRIVAILILIFPFISFGQKDDDYDIYKKAIIHQFKTWEIDIDTIPTIVITDNLTSFSKMREIRSLPDLIFNKDKSLRSSYVDHDSILFITTYDKEFEALFKGFSDNYTRKTNLNAENISFRNTDVIVVTNEKIERQFSKNRIKQLDRAWSRFYENYTRYGYFEFSDVFYSDNFAIMYMVRRASPLNGKGSIVIFKRINNNWVYFDEIEVWFA
jgi:hypothetical protein